MPRPRFVSALLLFLAGCGTSTHAEPAHPALWSFADADTTVYLFGTIHVLPEGVDWDGGRVGKAIGRADRLMLEVTDPEGQAGLQRSFQAMASAPGLPPLAERVAPEHRAELAAMLAKARIPPTALDGMETWAAALTLAATLYPEIGVSADQGVEARLTARFADAGKPVSGLETATEQFGYFDRLPEAAQRIFLTSVISERNEAGKQFDAMIAAWRKGDVATLAITEDDELSLSPELADALKRQRNAAWAARLQKALDQPGTVLVAVGAAHLAGKDSVQEMLEARGIKVKRVQ
ncbi:TraB/GumN family protein [Sphingomonas sanxanigenens]|uniref:TraB/GumN family protein n=1 Tax=Sphingomonas sanxanigenens DSM 19645 = NX02 TaxID=1123269 RepID=W0AF92_9SPHN|nr:TraB/GumN family protein [Sphingomonas sanxanigenens]AHE54958.1 hypothetical protein NX02_16395 [Sphingomonas sanxanigenens DSM 19645 = NX02]